MSATLACCRKRTGTCSIESGRRIGRSSPNNVEEFRARYRRNVDLHAGVVFLVAGAGFKAQKDALNAALYDIDEDSNLMNAEVLVEPYGDGYRVRRFDLP
jgi:hypothetical protein